MIKLTNAAIYIYNAYVICVCIYIYKYMFKYTENKLISAAIYTYIYIYIYVYSVQYSLPYIYRSWILLFVQYLNLYRHQSTKTHSGDEVDKW